MKKQFTSFLPVLSLLLAGSTVLSSCGKEDDAPIADHEFGPGVFVTNEGQFQKSNGDVSFIDNASKAVEQSVFLSVNSRPAGDVVQSMAFHNGKAYLIVNNSNKIEIANAATFKSEGVINGLKQPRYLVIANNKAYVSSWVKTDFVNRTVGEIAVVDLNTNTVVKTIPVGWLPERLLVANNKLFVPNSNDNSVTVINLGTETVESSITVGDSPNSLVLDAAGKVWVLGAGNYTTNSVSKLHRLNPATNTLEATFDFPFGSAEDLIINAARTTLFYNFGGQVFKMGINDAALPTTPFIDRYFYGIGVEPETNNFYGADAGNFSSNGKAIRYSATGQVLDSVTVGIAPNDFYFR